MQNWPEGVQKHIYQSVDSTMSEARRQAPVTAGAAWFLAMEQTAGTGRRGRAWDTQQGNFAATLLIRPNGAPSELALRSFVASLALYDALVAVSGRSDCFTLKWPNDVLLNGGKLAGILLETIAETSNQYALSVGIGVNLGELPSAAKLETVALRPRSVKTDLGLTVTPEQFLDALAPAFAHWEQQLSTYGFAPIRKAWLEKAANIGKPITARMTGRTVEGIFKTVDETGALILQTPNGPQSITAADISF